MKKKRLDRDIGWGFQGFPYYQFRLESEDFTGLVGYIDILSGETHCWNTEKAGDVPTTGAGMKWLQLVPDGKSRMLTGMIKPDGSLSVCYIDVIERLEFDKDGVAVYVDKYLDVVFTPQGDFGIQDRDELDMALETGDITKDQYDSAITELEKICREIQPDIKAAAMRLERVYRAVKTKVDNGDIKPLLTKYQKSKGEI